MSDFLDDLVSDQQFNENVDQGTLGRIETLIWQSSMSDQEKAREMKRMLNLESMEQAYNMIKWLQDFQPIVGTHRAPVTQYDSVEATRLRVEREDFKERKK
jgi:hypothetical protein